MPDAAPPPRAKIKRILLWAARHLNPCGDFHSGPVQVRVSFGVPGSDSAVVVPDADADGLTAPSSVRTNPAETAPGPDPVELRRHFLSDTERLILRAVAALEPCQGKAAHAEVSAAIARTDFYILWSNLQLRGLLVDGPKGYRLVAPWVAGMLGG